MPYYKRETNRNSELVSRMILTLYVGKIRFEKQGCSRLAVWEKKKKKKRCKHIREVTFLCYNKFMAGSKLGYPALAEKVPFRRSKAD